MQQRSSMSGKPTPRHPASPTYRVEGGSAGLAGCQTTLPPGPPASHAYPSWAGVVRGTERASEEQRACPPPSVTTADFTALFDRCMARGLKAHVTISHTSGLQLVTLSCSLPASNHIAAAPAKKRRRRPRRRCRRGKTAAVDGKSAGPGVTPDALLDDLLDDLPDPLLDPRPATTSTNEKLPPSTPTPLTSAPPLPSTTPDITSPPAKKTR